MLALFLLAELCWAHLFYRIVLLAVVLSLKGAMDLLHPSRGHYTVIRAIEVSHAACEFEFRRSSGSHGRGVFLSKFSKSVYSGPNGTRLIPRHFLDGDKYTCTHAKVCSRLFCSGYIDSNAKYNPNTMSFCIGSLYFAVLYMVGVSHTACKDEFRQNLRSHRWSVFCVFHVCAARCRMNIVSH